MMVIRYNFYEKQDIKKSLISIDSMMTEMYNIMLFTVNKLRLLQ